MFKVSRIDVKEWSRMSLSQKRNMRENLRAFYIRAIAVIMVNLALIFGFFFSLIMSTVMGQSAYHGPCGVCCLLSAITITATGIYVSDQKLLSKHISKPPHPDDIKEFARLSEQNGELTQV